MLDTLQRVMPSVSIVICLIEVLCAAWFITRTYLLWMFYTSYFDYMKRHIVLAQDPVVSATELYFHKSYWSLQEFPGLLKKLMFVHCSNWDVAINSCNTLALHGQLWHTDMSEPVATCSPIAHRLPMQIPGASLKQEAGLSECDWIPKTLWSSHVHSHMSIWLCWPLLI